MKKILLSFIFIVGIILLSSFAWADSDITFIWDPNSETDLAGYNLYQTNTQSKYTFGEKQAVASIPAGTEIVTVYNVPDGEWWWVVTAFDLSGCESERSNEVGLVLDTTPPVVPVGLNVMIKIIITGK